MTSYICTRTLCQYFLWEILSDIDVNKLYLTGITLHHMIFEKNNLKQVLLYSVFPFFSQLDGSIKRSHIKLGEVMDNDPGKNYLKDDKMAHKCNQCKYISSRVSHLRQHLKTHSGEKSNKCNQCDYASSQATNLRTHLKIHSGEK